MIFHLFSLLVDYELFEGKNHIFFTFTYLIADSFLELNIQYQNKSQIWDPYGLGLGSD